MFELFRWSRKDYQELWKVVLFHNMRVVLVDGVIWRKPMASPPACYSIGMLSDWLHSLTFPGHHDRHYSEIEIDEWNSLVPRFSIVKGDIRDYSTAHPTTATWVIEVSESTLAFDTTIGVELFATAKVPEYWVVDLENRRLLVYRGPEALPTGLGPRRTVHT